MSVEPGGVYAVIFQGLLHNSQVFGYAADKSMVQGNYRNIHIIFIDYLRRETTCINFEGNQAWDIQE